jgi:hypothetical protein
MAKNTATNTAEKPVLIVKTKSGHDFNLVLNAGEALNQNLKASSGVDRMTSSGTSK